MSHRSKAFDDIINEATDRLKRLLTLPHDYTVLLLHVGASLQFVLVPMNLCHHRTPAYTNTGIWSTNAIQEAVAALVDFRTAFMKRCA